MSLRRSISTSARRLGRPSLVSSKPRKHKRRQQSCPNHKNNQTDQGTIEGVFLFHRHGDRTPARRLVDDTYAVDETLFWQRKIPRGPSLYDSLSALFPTDIHFSNNEGKFFDTKREPYGFLTWKGMEQMRRVGRKFAMRYSQLGHQKEQIDQELDDAGRYGIDMSELAGGGGGAHSQHMGRQLLKYWDVQAYSTCYLRTVKSVQCFLHGLLGDDAQRSYLEYQDCEHKQQSLREEIAKEAVRERPVSPHDLVQVLVRDRSIDTLNAFDRNPDLMKELVTEVVDTPHFQKYDAEKADLAANLCDLLPGLLAPGQKRLFGGPSGINWIFAADHFICRQSHSLQYSRFSASQQDERAEEYLASMYPPVITHLAWRFRQWYKSPPLLAAIAAPPLREIEQQIQKAVQMDTGQKRPLVVYSCHDVTILSLLYGLGADFLEEDGDQGWQFWPSYASTLVLELVRVKAGSGDVDDTHEIRIALDDKPIRVVSLRTKQHETDRDRIRLSDFSKIIDKLEEDGGWGPNGRLSSDPACNTVERDMSGWTG